MIVEKFKLVFGVAWYFKFKVYFNAIDFPLLISS